VKGGKGKDRKKGEEGSELRMGGEVGEMEL
jgi:hypothetical protein